MSKHVKGTLFVDYVRMVRSQPDVDWNKYLIEEDLDYIAKSRRIVASSWYPFDTFERMGIGILNEIGGGDVEMARLWGHASTDHLVTVYKNLVESGNPTRTMEKFNIIRNSFFDFPCVDIEIVPGENRMILRVFYSTNLQAVQGQAWQTLGWIERLLQMTGAKEVEHKVVAKIWEGDPETIIELNWT